MLGVGVVVGQVTMRWLMLPRDCVGEACDRESVVLDRRMVLSVNLLCVQGCYGSDAWCDASRLASKFVNGR